MVLRPRLISGATCLIILVSAVACIDSAAPAANSLVFTQQGTKLVGTGAVGTASQGSSVSLSADGSTALIGGSADSLSTGAAWVWIRNGDVWTQQGPKLVGTGIGGACCQGYSVALSADGNTAIIGRLGEGGTDGATRVWTRSGEVWTPQGPELLATGPVVTTPYFGYSVALAADGNTALIAGPSDNGDVGAAWVWTRSVGVWTQQGPKLVGTGAVGSAFQGRSVSLSADGNTAIIGGDRDNAGAGAVWVWIRSGGVWTQQGPKLVGSGAVGSAHQGQSVSLSADGNTAIIGGDGDSAYAGAAWVWTRSGSAWTQQGPKLVGADGVGRAYQGISVSLSADGNTAVVGGDEDDGQTGATWVWRRNGGVWTQQGLKLVGTDAVGRGFQGGSVSLSADGHTAIIGGYLDNNNVGAAWVFTSQ